MGILKMTEKESNLNRTIFENENLCNEIETLRLAKEDFVTNVQQFFLSQDSNLICSICQDVFILSTTLSCGHTFCEDCVARWRQTRNVCPICRQHISTYVYNRDLDNFTSSFIDKFMPSSYKEERERIVSQRKTIYDVFHGI